MRLLLIALVAVVACGVSALVAVTPGVVRYSDMAGQPYTVSWDNRSVILHPQQGGAIRSVFFSAGIHYPRFTPGQWDDLFLKAKADGYNMVQTYFFLNAHLPKLGGYPYIQDGPANLTHFLELAIKYDMFVNLRIGPYVCAEWSWGGYSYDLGLQPNLVSRSSNANWEAFMTAVVLNVTRDFRGYFADRGGPIAMGQVENELHTSDTDYVDFCGALAVKTGVPIFWGMCNGNSAAQTVNTCNGGDCTGFAESNGQNGQVFVTQPGVWTENWMGWFDLWEGGPAGNWPSFNAAGQSASKARGILQWFARGGSHVNFYNWAGGKEFARNAGSSIVNAYYWDSPLASDNLAQGPERVHMRRLFAALAVAAPFVLAAPAQVHRSVDVPWYDAGGVHAPNGQHAAYLYASPAGVVVFVENNGGGVGVVIGGQQIVAPPGTSVLALNGTVLFTSSDVQTDGSQRVWLPQPAALLAPWAAWQDPVIPATVAEIPRPTPERMPWAGSALGAVVVSAVPLEQVNFTEYDTEIAVYVTVLSPDVLKKATQAGQNVDLVLASAVAQGWAVFLNGNLLTTCNELSHADGKASISCNVPVPVSVVAAGQPTTLALMSTSLGIGNGGGINNGPTPDTFSSTGVKGITSQKPGAVMFGGQDLTVAATWTHVVGAAGEALTVYAANGAHKVPWVPLGAAVTAPPLTWLSTYFTAPPETLTPPLGVEMNVSLNVDVSGLSRGRMWVNGFDLGRYWTISCGGEYMCQRYYSVPHDLLKPGSHANLLVLLDELGVANISDVTLVTSANMPPPPCATTPVNKQAAAMVDCASPSAQWVPTTSNNRTTFASKNTPSLCLGVLPNTTSVVGLVPCAATDATQQWDVVAGHSTVGHDGNCLDIFNMNSSFAAALDVWSCNGGSNQQWALSTLTLKSALNGLCVGFCH